MSVLQYNVHLFQLNYRNEIWSFNSGEESSRLLGCDVMTRYDRAQTSQRSILNPEDGGMMDL